MGFRAWNADLEKLLIEDAGVDLLGYELVTVEDVSGDGRSFVGWAFSPEHNGEAYVAHVGTVRLGDVNCDESIDFDDIDAFVLALSDADECRRESPDCDAGLADIDRDGIVDAADIDPFICCLIRGACYDCR